MSIPVLIMGESGSGKSTAIRTLNAEETYIINVLNKPLPFKGYKSLYSPTSEERAGNYFASDNHEKIRMALQHVSNNLENIKVIVIDDFQYIMGNEFMRRALEKGYDKFSEIAQHAWQTIEICRALREDLIVFFLSHTQYDGVGRYKCKSVGKLFDGDAMEGLFTIVLHAVVGEDGHLFLTKSAGQHSAKSPIGLFDDPMIPNDLQLVVDKINQYNDNATSDIPQ